MVLTPSTMRLPLGFEAPDFSLPSPSGKMHCLANFEERRALLVAFLCNHCPYVKHVAPAFAKLATEYQERGVGVVAINSSRHPLRAELERFRIDSSPQTEAPKESTAKATSKPAETVGGRGVAK